MVSLYDCKHFWGKLENQQATLETGFYSVFQLCTNRCSVVTRVAAIHICSRESLLCETQNDT